MRNLTPGEVLSLREILQSESNALAMASTAHIAISDPELKSLSESGLTVSRSRIRGLQEFIKENNIIQEVH